MDGREFARAFTAPPAAYRPAPFFVFNDEHEGVTGEARITRMLEDYRQIGFGGAFLHPRPGLITEYLSPRWFALIRHAVSECLRLGLIPYLYDENSYPSGVGGGHVPARVPETRTRFVTPVFGHRPQAVPAHCLALHRWQQDNPAELVSRQELAEGEPWIAFVMDSMEASPWHGETACPSLLDPRTTTAFLETTYVAYQQALGDLWSALPAIFTDEPHLPAQSHGPWNRGLHLTPYVLGEFERRRGYDLRPHLASIFFDVGDYRAVRFDLYDLMHQLWVENWALPMERWCAKHGVALTGHYLEHDWPCPYATPGHTHLLAHMSWPGTDMLETLLLTGHEFHDVQNFHPAPDGQEPHGLVYLRQVHAIANQLGKERVLDECWGAGGNDSTPADWSRIGRWLIVHGVNLLNPHLTWLTIRGTRKTDHPQTFSDHSPWFDYLRPINDELSRLCRASNQGRIEQRILVLDPLTTGYCVSRKADCLPEGEGHTAVTPPGGSQVVRGLASVLPLQLDTGELVQGLSDRQADFDLGDEYVIEEFGRVDGDQLAVGQQTYQLLVWPGCMSNLRQATVATIASYLAGGGVLYGVRPDTITVDGRPADVLSTWSERYPGQCRWFPTNQALIEAMLTRLPPRLRLSNPPATGVAHMRRVLDNGEIFLIVNSAATACEGDVRFTTAYQRLYELDPATGQCFAHPVERAGHDLGTTISLRPRTATILLASNDDLPTDQRSPSIQLREDNVALTPTRVERTAPNVLVIDTCELTMSGRTYSREAVYVANHRLWRAHGFETNGWMAVIQYRDQVLGQNRRMEPASGGSATYEVEIAPDVDLAAIRLAIETPELWRVTVNEQPIDVAAGERWLDDHIRAANVGKLLKPGANMIRLVGQPFDVRRELDQIYLLGEFACEPTAVGFRLVSARPLALGSWRAQGCPFYDREVTYGFTLPESAGRGLLTLDDGGWTGSFLIVEQGDQTMAQLAEPPFKVELNAAAGRAVTLRVVGLPKNLLGPFHDPAKPRRQAWPAMWYGAKVPTAPQPGEGYDLLDLGLMAPPRWRDAVAERS